MKKLFKGLTSLMGYTGVLTYIFLGIISGLSSFLFISFVTRAINLILDGTFHFYQVKYALIFSGIICLFILSRRVLTVGTIKMSQSIVWKLRKEIISWIMTLDYRQLSIRRNEIYSVIVSDINVLTSFSLVIIDFFTAIILTVACMIYLATISLPLFLITLLIVLLGILTYWVQSKWNYTSFSTARKLETHFMQNLNVFLDGFKEIFMDLEKGRELYNDETKKIAEEAYQNNTSAFKRFLDSQIIGQLLFYLLISTILVFFSVRLKIRAIDTVGFVYTLFYLLGSIQVIMSLLPNLVRAKIAYAHIMQLSTEMLQADIQTSEPGKYVFSDEFNEIVIKDIEYNYGEIGKNFGIGPINLTIRKGESIFIYGGNGSGKTTLVSVIIGLCIPSKGELRFNNTLINDDNYTAYRKKFAVVFSDYYLFDRLLAIEHFDIDKWHYYLKLFELEGKVTMENRKLHTPGLSTGQKKRLALIVSLMEKKPVLVLDEWAADQDPYFRQKFYTTIIPVLTGEGFTVIAITHDDTYYPCADKLYKMDYGKLSAENTETTKLNFIS